jgi:ATPase family associated with various cellular activities (AAA)/AAA lid domain
MKSFCIACLEKAGSMPERNPADLVPYVEDFRDTLEEIEELYRACALECVHNRLDLRNDSADEFVRRMIDLSHGLMLKTFVDVAYADREWSPEALVLAGDLFEFVWNKRLKRRQLKDSLVHFLADSKLTWDALLGPFEKYGPFRSKAQRVQTAVMRLANLVAKANGQLTPEEIRRLRWTQAEMRRILEPVPLSETLAPSATAVQQAFDTLPDVPVTPHRRVHPVDDRSPEERLQEGLAELDALIGLDSVKQEVRGLINFIKMQKAREQFNLPHTPVSLHTVFSGNPGTGKTTVARHLGKIFSALGLLANGHLCETDRSGLVAEYAGQTGPKSHKKIDEALDGVLFIDEAYSLVAESGDDPYGNEALQVLLKRMEDDRNRLVVILAGYPKPLDRLIKSNPGLSSRFNRNLFFPDYSAPELGRIFEGMCRQNRYTLPTLTRVKLLLGFNYLVAHRDEHFGNARLARNVFEQAIGRLANRITSIVPLTHELLTTLEPDDVFMEGVPAEIWTNLEYEKRMFQLPCPGCRQTSRLPQSFLGRTVQCTRCERTFEADWGDLAEPS